MRYLLSAAAALAIMATAAPTASAKDLIVDKSDYYNRALAKCGNDKACKVRVSRLRLLDAQKDVTRSQQRLEDTIVRQGRLICRASTGAMDLLTPNVIAKNRKVRRAHKKLVRETRDQYKLARKLYKDGHSSRRTVKNLKKVYKGARRVHRDYRDKNGYLELFWEEGFGSATEKVRCGEFARKF